MSRVNVHVRSGTRDLNLGLDATSCGHVIGGIVNFHAAGGYFFASATCSHRDLAVGGTVTVGLSNTTRPNGANGATVNNGNQATWTVQTITPVADEHACGQLGIGLDWLLLSIAFAVVFGLGIIGGQQR